MEKNRNKARIKKNLKEQRLIQFGKTHGKFQIVI